MINKLEGEQKTVICKYANSKKACEKCSHAIPHIKNCGCMLPTEVCRELGCTSADEKS
jgi:hypothetical protein